MTPYSQNPLQSRKDFGTLISHQTDIPCLQDGCGAESMLAFLMQIYAYVFAKFGNDYYIDTPEHNAAGHFGGTDILKSHLMSSGPYHAVVYKSDLHLRPRALRLRQRPAIYSGPSIGAWLILWPGAVRDTFFKTGRPVSAFKQLTLNLKVDGAKRYTPIATLASMADIAIAPSDLRKTVAYEVNCPRLIPP